MKINHFDIIGLSAGIAYLLIILFTWIGTVAAGYTYFQAGEPNTIIRNIEWVLGITAIITQIRIMKKVMED